MSRTVTYWVAVRDDTPIPPRVRLRVFDRFDGRCQCGCNRKILAGETWECDHVVALINGGSHSEGNLQPLLTKHHREKTKADVAIKSKVARTRAKHLGLRKRSSFQTNRDSPFKKKMDGTVERRSQIRVRSFADAGSCAPLDSPLAPQEPAQIRSSR